MKVGSERQATSRHARLNYAPVEIGYTKNGICPRGPSKSGPVLWECTPIKSPILRWDFLWKSYSLSGSKQIWTTNRRAYIMFFKDLEVFANQILAFAMRFSWILLVGVVQANTFCANVWNSREKEQQLEIQKLEFQRNHSDFLVFARQVPKSVPKTADLQPWPSEIIKKPRSVA